MSFWNPLSWGGDVAHDVMENIGKAIKGMGRYAVEHPEETGTAVAVGLLSIAAFEGSKTAGRKLGEAGAAKIIEISEEEYEIARQPDD